MSDHRIAPPVDPAYDRRVAPTQPGSRMARRQAAAAAPPPPPYDRPPRSHRGGGGKPGGQNKMRVLAWVSIGLTTVMVAGALTGYTVYRDAFGNIKQKSVKEDIINPRPPDTGALNVLLVGSDTRAGKGNAQYGQQLAREADAGGKRTDTIILLHISPNRDQARLISFPRDSMVQIPKCRNETTKQEMPPRRDMINSAYNSGGIACTMSTIETLTGIRVNHFVEVDFSGFKNIVDALGGIEICLKSGVNDRASKLVLPPGKSLLNGEKALGYVRLRHYGDGSDIQRIRRQQIFLSKVVAKATSSALLTDVGKLRDFIAAAAGSVTMDPELANDTEQLIEIAMSARELTASGVKFTTIPWVPDPLDKNRVVWKEPDAQELFTAIRTDTEVTKNTAPSPSASASAKPKVTVKPEQVKVEVLNGTKTVGKAREVADQLAKEGFAVVSVGNYEAPGGVSLANSEIHYAKTGATAPGQADTLAGSVLPKPAPAAGKVKAVNPQPYTWTQAGVAPKGAPVVQLLVGEDFKSVKVTKLPDSVENNSITASQQKNVCT
ncbi:LCP family protein [Nonomuraea jiangxiensis]|uniref:Cell envelope-related function transcriptional attenuator common domain-containing protein n=1 Tax=Nonomuraea jiangxiensis TaxID=633440 RepID=A0A1G8F722_9ACTN|nr:LCP family protein [Nonomuraea jiangxiensis]SDH77922.1 cell envelope-related function transcriptional attenuator common domain-containing protein [Nonomuraea jiangxiensis]